MADPELLEDLRRVARGLRQSLRGEGQPLDLFIASLAVSSPQKE
jgi:hypothetical protein